MKIQDLVHIALFSALTAALGLIPPLYPFGLSVPITAQTLGVMLAGSILGAKRGAISQLLFILLVAAGLPLLSGGRGGLGVFALPSAGFLLAFPLAAAAIGLIVEKLWTRLTFLRTFAANVIGGIGVIYLLGVPVFAFMSGVETAIIGSATYLPGDFLKALFAAYIAMFVKRGYPIISAPNRINRS